MSSLARQSSYLYIRIVDQPIDPSLRKLHAKFTTALTLLTNTGMSNASIAYIVRGVRNQKRAGTDGFL